MRNKQAITKGISDIIIYYYSDGLYQKSGMEEREKQA